MTMRLQLFRSGVFPGISVVLACCFLAAQVSKAEEQPNTSDSQQASSSEKSSKDETKSEPAEAKTDEQVKADKQTETNDKSNASADKSEEQADKSDESPGKDDSSKEDSSTKSERSYGRSSESSGRSSDRGKPEDATKPTLRPTKPLKSPNPDELKVRPDAEGKVKFNFNGQPWLPVLEWLADISGMSLDWQELPSDYLNLNTQSSYTIREARDLINSHLLTRGYTLLCNGEVLTVANVKKLNPSMVPRISPKELADRDPHEFVKVSFPLDWMLAESAVEEVKPMLSPNGKLIPLKNTNRMEAMDAVINLRDIWSLLSDEQSDNSQERLVREFRLQYARASEVKEQLESLLAGDTKPSPEPQQEQQQPDQNPSFGGMPPGRGSGPDAVFMGQMLQAMQGQGGRRGNRPSPQQPQQVAAGQKPPNVTLVVNQRLNSILAHASPDKMAIIAQAIEAIDVPTDKTLSLMANVNRMQVYRLTGVDPEPVVKTLQEVGNLDPKTRLQIDSKNKAIIAYASLADHVTIRTIVDRLSGSERRFEVISLRRLDADYVAGSIEFMMLGTNNRDKINQSRQSNRYRFGGYGDQPMTTDTQPNADQFRVDADIENNRLLLWANEVELAEVENLLVKLGEIPPRGSRRETVRVIDTKDIKNGEELLKRIERAWPSISPNPLKVNPSPKSEKQPLKRSEEKRTPPSELPSKSAYWQPFQPDYLKFVQFRREEGTASQSGGEEKTDKSLPPVEVTLDADGRIIISSDDPQALAAFEDLAAQFSPSRKDYHVFRLKYAWAYGVALNLEEFFKDDEKKETRRSYWDYWNGSGDSQSDRATRLSKRRPIKFISDSDTNTILVENANPAQLKTVEDLIELYDQPSPTDSQSARKTETIHLQHSKAKVVADTVKDVYRDLLSDNDRALMGARGNARESGRSFTYVYSDFGDSSDNKRSEQKAPKFKGLLSIGVDDLSNSVVVSAPNFLFEQVVKMIKELDQAAAPTSTIKVVKLGQGVSGLRAQQVLSGLLGEKEGANIQGQNRQQQQEQQNRGGNSSSQNRQRNRRSNN